MYELFWNLRQEQRIREARHDVRDAKRTADEAARQLDELSAQVDSLRLMCAALGSLLQERCSITDEEFQKRVHEIDLRDGMLDGKTTPQVAKCQRCGRQMAPRHKWCLYCGAEELEIAPPDPKA